MYLKVIDVEYFSVSKKWDGDYKSYMDIEMCDCFLNQTYTCYLLAVFTMRFFILNYKFNSS